MSHAEIAENAEKSVLPYFVNTNHTNPHEYLFFCELQTPNFKLQTSLNQNFDLLTLFCDKFPIFVTKLEKIRLLDTKERIVLGNVKKFS